MLSARAAVLLALRQGPSYGRQVVRRLQASSGRAIRLALGSLYPALRTLEKERLVRSWTVVPGRRRGGRARRYYELTERGVRASEAVRSAFLGLLGIEPRRPLDSAEELEARRQRLERAAEISEAMMWLREQVYTRRRRRSA
jgi:PadR family transcriptional regulator, regulatory protein PadR